MAFPRNTSFHLALILLVLNVHLFARTSATPLSDVCSQVSDRSFCLNNFGSNPKTRNATLPLLGDIAIDRLRGDGASISKTIHSLMLIARDPFFKTLLSWCEILYTDALNGLITAKDDLKNGRYRDVRDRAMRAERATVRCENGFKSPYKSLLTFENRNYKNLGDILDVIAFDLNRVKGFEV